MLIPVFTEISLFSKLYCPSFKIFTFIFFATVVPIKFPLT
nr:MAG TPA: hypothetical protein [Bacteriophage sp.]